MCVSLFPPVFEEEGWGGLLERHSLFFFKKAFNAASRRKALIEIHGLAPIAPWCEQSSERHTASI